MPAEGTGRIKSNGGERCKKQVSGSYGDVIGQIQITRVLALTFLMRTFFPAMSEVCLLHCHLLSAMSKFQESAWESQGGKQKWCSGHGQNKQMTRAQQQALCATTSFGTKLFLPVGTTFIYATSLWKVTLLREKDCYPV